MKCKINKSKSKLKRNGDAQGLVDLANNLLGNYLPMKSKLDKDNLILWE